MGPHILFLKAIDKRDSRTVDLFGTHVETRTRKDGVVQQYHVSAEEHQKDNTHYSNTSNINPVINEQGGAVELSSCNKTLAALEQESSKRVDWFKGAINEMNAATEAGAIIKVRYAEVRSALGRAFDSAFSRVGKQAFLDMPREQRPDWFQDVYYASGLSSFKKVLRTLEAKAGDPLADAALSIAREWAPIIAQLDALKDKVTTTAAVRSEKKEAETKARALVPRTKLSAVVQAAVHAYKPELVNHYTEHVTRLYGRMVEDLGPELKGVSNSSRWAKVYGHTMRAVLGAGRKLDPARVQSEANSYAEAVAETMQGKIMSKAGELDNPEVKALDGARFILTGEMGGKKVKIEQNMILNWSKYGNPYNQFPARITFDGKAVSEAEFKTAQVRGAAPLAKAILFLAQ